MNFKFKYPYKLHLRILAPRDAARSEVNSKNVNSVTCLPIINFRPCIQSSVRTGKGTRHPKKKVIRKIIARVGKQNTKAINLFS